MTVLPSYRWPLDIFPSGSLELHLGHCFGKPPGPDFGFVQLVYLSRGATGGLRDNEPSSDDERCTNSNCEWKVTREPRWEADIA